MDFFYLKESVTLCIPSIRGDGALMGVCIAAINQTHPPVRALLLDTSPKGVSANPSLLALLQHLNFEIIRPDDRELPIHPYNGRRRLAERATTPWIWFVDDDLFPKHDCLERLLSAAREWGVGLVSGQKIEVNRRYGRDFCLECSGMQRDVAIPYADTANLLVQRVAWLALTKDLSFDFDKTGEEVAATALTIKQEGGMHAHRATGLHISDNKPSEWNQPIYTTANCEEFDGFVQLKSRVSASDYKLMIEYAKNRIAEAKKA